MENNKEKALSIADDLSNLIINKILAKDITISEGFKTTAYIMTGLISKTLPEDKFASQLERTIPLSTIICESINKYVKEQNELGKTIGLVEVILSLANNIEFTLEYNKK